MSGQPRVDSEKIDTILVTLKVFKPESKSFTREAASKYCWVTIYKALACVKSRGIFLISYTDPQCILLIHCYEWFWNNWNHMRIQDLLNTTYLYKVNDYGCSMKYFIASFNSEYIYEKQYINIYLLTTNLIFTLRKALKRHRTVAL